MSAKLVMGMALGGLGFGLVDKTMPALPTIPVLGRAGTIALAAYFIGKDDPDGIAMNVAKAAAAIAGYEFGREGKVSGVDGDIAPQEDRADFYS